MKCSSDECQVRARLVRLSEVREVLKADRIAKAGGGGVCDTRKDGGACLRWASGDKEGVINGRAVMLR